MTGRNEAGLFCRARSGDRRALDRLAQSHMPLVHHIARRFAQPGASIYDDLVGAGCLGLSRALDRYDPDRGTRFTTYAFPLILGEMRQLLRSEGPVHMGRAMRRAVGQARQLEREARESDRGETLAEIAGQVGVDPADLAMAMEADQAPAELEMAASWESPRGDPASGVDRLALRQALDRLPEDLARLVTLRYFRDLSQERVAAVLGLSQSQVSRRERKARDLLRDQLI